MKMSVIREHSPRDPHLVANMQVSRSLVKVAVIGAVRQYATKYWAKHTTDGPRKLYDHIGEVLLSLPDDDVLELNYAIDEMSRYQLAKMFMDKMNSMNALRKQIIDVANSYLEEEEM